MGHFGCYDSLVACARCIKQQRTFDRKKSLGIGVSGPIIWSNVCRRCKEIEEVNWFITVTINFHHNKFRAAD